MRYPGQPLIAGERERETVLALQQALNSMGVGPIPEDGVFGPSTEAAVRLFQARTLDGRGRPLAVDGVVGPLTWAALFRIEPQRAEEPTTEYARRVLEVAASQLEVREEPEGSNRGKEVEAYLGSVGLDGGQAWCAAFVYWCYERARRDELNPCPRTGGVHEMWRRSAGRLRYTPSQARHDPSLVRPGQLFFMDHGSGLGHVGFIEAIEGVYLVTIEGNTNAGGSREGIGVFRRTTRKIADVDMGFADLTQALA